MDDRLLTLLIVVTSVSAVCSVVSVGGLFIIAQTISRTLADTARWRIEMAATVAKLPTLEELRSINKQALEAVQPQLESAVKAALPADVNRALIMETLERIGLEVPPPPPELPDEELRTLVHDLMVKGIALAEETARQNKKGNKPYDGLDKRRVCLNFVRAELADRRREYPESRLASELETTLAVMRLTKKARDGYR